MKKIYESIITILLFISGITFLNNIFNPNNTLKTIVNTIALVSILLLALFCLIYAKKHKLK